MPTELCYIHPANPHFLGARVNITSEDGNNNCPHVTQASLPVLSSKLDGVSEQYNPCCFGADNEEDDQMCPQIIHPHSH